MDLARIAMISRELGPELRRLVLPDLETRPAGGPDENRRKFYRLIDPVDLDDEQRTTQPLENVCAGSRPTSTRRCDCRRSAR